MTTIPLRPNELCRYDSKLAAVAAARANEKRTGQPHYVLRFVPNAWTVATTMPLLGEWYSTDGIRHG